MPRVGSCGENRREISGWDEVMDMDSMDMDMERGRMGKVDEAL